MRQARRTRYKLRSESTSICKNSPMHCSSNLSLVDHNKHNGHESSYPRTLIFIIRQTCKGLFRVIALCALPLTLALAATPSGPGERAWRCIHPRCCVCPSPLKRRSSISTWKISIKNKSFHQVKRQSQ